MFITTGIALLLGAQAPMQKIDYRVEIMDSRGVVMAPVVKVLDKQTGEIEIDSELDKAPRSIDVQITPTMDSSGEITTSLQIRFMEFTKMSEPKESSERIMMETYRSKPGQAGYTLLHSAKQHGENAFRWVWDKPDHKLIRGEYLITITPTIETH